jgi:hypothetical protein
MKITSNNNTYEINRIDFCPVMSRDILPELEWYEGVSEGNQYMNVKIDDNGIAAIEAFSGTVYIRK